jgi:hypothetical protein
MTFINQTVINQIVINQKSLPSLKTKPHQRHGQSEEVVGFQQILSGYL